MPPEAEKPETKGAGKTEKDRPARSAEPSNRKASVRDIAVGERSFADMQNSSDHLFSVPFYVLVGAAMNSGIDINEPINEQEMRNAVEEFLAKEAS